MATSTSCAYPWNEGEKHLNALGVSEDTIRRWRRRDDVADGAHTPHRLQTTLTEVTDRFCVTGERQPTGHHAFDRVCTDNCIEHRLIKPRRPQTNGMVERFNGRFAEVLRTLRFDSATSLQTTLKRFVYLYNYHIPQKGLRHKTPLQMLQKWYAQKNHLSNPPT